MTNSSFTRPQPDFLLEKIKEEELKAKRGKLRIYFGASAGVGKTYAMLNAAQTEKQRQKNILIGLIETHNRRETQSLVNGIEKIPLKEIEHKGRTLYEFDLDAALAANPEIILVDELAHSNAPGCRHPKRWQDIQELLDAGIDVWTALNVQHLESLNGTIGTITGVRVHETVPDVIIEKADEVILVDVTADELINRLKAGKVYVSKQAEQAENNFFKKGNLIALREIALRKTAERVGDDVRSYRINNSSQIASTGIADAPSWHTSQTLLVCVGPADGAEHAVRSGARLAAQLSVKWYVAYVETPALQRLPSKQRDKVLTILKLAEELGANTTVLTGNDIASALYEYAHRLNCATLLLGRPGKYRWSHLTRVFRPTLTRQLANLAPEIDIIEISTPDSSRKINSYLNKELVEDSTQHFDSIQWTKYRSTVFAGIATTAIAYPISYIFDLANIVMLFLVYVVACSVKYGRRPAMLAAVLAVLCFDFFFVPPRFSFAIADAQYLFTFIVMLGVGLLIGQLTANLTYSARISASREQKTNYLFELTRELSAALHYKEVIQIGERTVSSVFGEGARIFIAGADNTLEITHPTPEEFDESIADWVFNNSKTAGLATNTLSATPWHYVPLIAPMNTRGVLAIKPTNTRWLLIPEQVKLLDTMARQISIALERVHYVEIAQQTTIEMESEHLRNTLLATISHDLRTPLTSLIGFAENLTLSQPPLSFDQSNAAKAIHHEAKELFALVSNLLEMAKLQSGRVNLRKDWYSIGEIVGTSIRLCHQSMGEFTVECHIPVDLPLLRCDAVLMERAFVNLIENAVKYAKPHTDKNKIIINANIQGSLFSIYVRDHGPGLIGQKNLNGNFLFEKFTRGQTESTTRGVGLGLSIVKAIIEAHEGTITAKNAVDRGAIFLISLPLETQPKAPAEIIST